MLKPQRVRARRISRVLSCEMMEQRRLLCGLPHDLLPAAPEFDWGIEAAEAARLAAEHPGEGGPEAVSIVWTNRGLASDNFAATFGTMAGTARAVVDAALNDWARVITNFNRSDNSLSLQVSISISGTGFGGAGAPASSAPADGKPRTGSFTIAAGRPDLFPDPNDNNGWYLDPTPTDSAEFTTVMNAFGGRGSGLGSDMYSVVTAEMTHVLGLISDKTNSGGAYQGYLLESSGYATNTNVVDNAEGGGSWGRFWVFNGPTVDHLMTSYNSGDQNSTSWGNIVHSAGIRSSGTLLFNGKNYQGADDVGNATYAGSERTMPSWTMAHVLKDAYGYSIIDPETFGSFYANLNRDTGVLTVRGGDAHIGSPVTNDKIYISCSGSTITVAVDVPADIPGSYALPGGGDFPAWTSTFSTAEVSSIVVEAGAGDDDIYVYGVPAGVSVVVNAGSGNDFIQTGDGDVDDINTGVQGNVTVNGGAGTDTLSFYDFTDAIGNDTYTVTSSSVRKTATSTSGFVNYATVESVSVTGNPQANTFQVNTTAAGVNYSLNGFGGNDTFNIGNGDFDTNIDGPITVSGGAGDDLIVINDTSDALNDTYQVSGNRFEKTSGGTGSVVANSSTETLRIDGSNNNNTWSVPQLTSTLDVIINAGTGNDSLSGFFGNNFDSNLLSSLTFNGSTGTDSITVNDQGSAGLNYNLDNNSLDKGGAGVLNYSGLESFTLNCNAGNNDILMLSSASNCSYNVNGNGGDDQLRINDGSSFLFNFGGQVTFSGGAGTLDQISITDSGFAGVGTYTITNGQIAMPFNGFNVFFDTIEQMIVSASQGNNTINVNQTSIFTLVSGLDGDDTINIGNGNFAANITANVVVAGGAGANLAIINDTANAGNNTWTVTSGSTTHDGAAASVFTSFLFGVTLDALRIDAGAGNSVFNVNSIGSASTSMNLNIQAGNGADTVNLADGNFADMFGAVTVNGQGGSDSVVVNDLADAGADTYTLNSTTFSKSDWAFSHTYSSVENFRLEANGANNVITVNSTNVSTSYELRGNNGADTFNIFESNVAVIIEGGAALDVVNVNTDNIGSASARFATSQDLANLNIGAGGLVTLDFGKRLIDTVDAVISGRLNLADGGLIDRAAANEATYRTLLTNGFQGGTWNGPQPAIFSTAAAGGPTNDGVGYGTGAQTGLVNFFSSPVAAGDLMIRYTLNGDSNLDGSVNINDFALLAANFNTANTNWSRGNYNYDLNTDISDFAQLAANFNTVLPSDPQRPAASPFSAVRVAAAMEEERVLGFDRDTLLAEI